MLSALAAAAWIAVLARWLGGDDFGDLMLLVALSTIFAALADGGVSVEVCRQVGEHPQSARAVFGCALRVRLAFAVPAMILLSAAYLSVSDRRSFAALVLILVSTVATMLHQLSIATFRSAGMRRIEPIADTLPRLAILVVGISLGREHVGLVMAAGLYACADLALAAVMLRSMSRSLVGTEAAPEPDAFSPRRLVRRGVGLGLWSLQQRALVWVVALLTGGPEIARFAAAQRAADAALLPASAVGIVSVPQVASSNPSDRRGTLAMLVSIAFAVGIPVAIIGLVNGGGLAGFAFGQELRAAGPTITVLLLAVPIAGAGQVLVQVAAAIEPQRQLRAALLSVVAMLAVAIVAVPSHGAVGAAVAALSGHVVLVVALAPLLWSSTEPLADERILAASRSMSS